MANTGLQHRSSTSCGFPYAKTAQDRPAHSIPADSCRLGHCAVLLPQPMEVVCLAGCGAQWRAVRCAPDCWHGRPTRPQHSATSRKVLPVQRRAMPSAAIHNGVRAARVACLKASIKTPCCRHLPSGPSPAAGRGEEAGLIDFRIDIGTLRPGRAAAGGFSPCERSIRKTGRNKTPPITAALGHGDAHDILCPGAPRVATNYASFRTQRYSLICPSWQRSCVRQVVRSW